MRGVFRDASGVVLATVLVFLVVLSLTAALAAALSRTNTHLVNNLQNGKEAFYAAEAGIDEALYRLSMNGSATATISGVSGSPFVASLAPVVPPRVVGAGASAYGINLNNPLTTAQVLFTTSAPSAGVNNRAPTLQRAAAARVPYSTAVADSAATDITSLRSLFQTTANLTIGWDLCVDQAGNLVDQPGAGCNTTNSFYPIRFLPAASPAPRPVVKIVSTGRVLRPDGSAVASRKITVRAWDCDLGKGPPSILTTGSGCADPGIKVGGNNHITADGAVNVNAGAASVPLSACTSAIKTNGGGTITAAEINSVGGVNGNVNPSAQTGGDPYPDPYAAPVLRPPCYPGGPASCQGSMITQTGMVTPSSGAPTPCGGSSAASPSLCSAGSDTTLSPGIYYGGIQITGTNVTLANGVYVIAGGGFSVATGTTGVRTQAGGGAMIFNTYNPNLGPSSAGAFDLSGGNSTPSLTAPPAGQEFAGVVLFQERNLPLNPQPPLKIKGGTTGARILEGLIYAPDAVLDVQGNNPIDIGGSLIVRSIDFTGGADLSVHDSTVGPSACVDNKYSILAWQDF